MKVTYNLPRKPLTIGCGQVPILALRGMPRRLQEVMPYEPVG